MKEIKIIFRKPKETLKDSWFDVYIDGEKENNVKRVYLDASNEDIWDGNCANIETGFSYGLEKYIDLTDEFDEDD